MRTLARNRDDSGAVAVVKDGLTVSHILRTV